MNDELLLYFQLALKKGIIEPNEIVHWADDYISSNNVEDIGVFIFDLSLSGGLDCEILDILKDEVYARDLCQQKIGGRMFLKRFKKNNLFLDGTLLNMITMLLELSHEVIFTDEELDCIYIIDEYRDQFLEGMIGVEKVRIKMQDFLALY